MTPFVHMSYLTLVHTFGCSAVQQCWSYLQYSSPLHPFMYHHLSSPPPSLLSLQSFCVTSPPLHISPPPLSTSPPPLHHSSPPLLSTTTPLHLTSSPPPSLLISQGFCVKRPFASPARRVASTPTTPSSSPSSHGGNAMLLLEPTLSSHLLIHPINTPSRHTLCPPYQRTLMSLLLSTLYFAMHPLVTSSRPINAPSQHIFSTHPLHPPTHPPTHPLHPTSPPTKDQECSPAPAIYVEGWTARDTPPTKLRPSR